MWHLGSDTSRVLYSGLKYPTGCLLEMVQNPEGQSREYNMTSFLTIPCIIPGMGALFYWNVFQQSSRLAGNVDEGLKWHNVGL